MSRFPHGAENFAQILFARFNLKGCVGVIQKRASVTSGSNVVCSVHVYGLFSFSSLASKMQNGQKYHLLLLQKPKKMTGGSMDITRVKSPGFFSI